jgi:hypothetical protein
VQSAALLASDNGSGEETLEGFLTLAILTDFGFASDALISRRLDSAESGAGTDLAALKAALSAEAESGHGEEMPVLTGLAAMEEGIGDDLFLIFKDIFCGDGGIAKDTLKQIIETACKSADARVRAGAGRKESAGGKRAKKGSGKVRRPSREVKR